MGDHGASTAHYVKFVEGVYILYCGEPGPHQQQFVLGRPDPTDAMWEARRRHHCDVHCDGANCCFLFRCPR